jgi:predicted permease
MTFIASIRSVGTACTLAAVGVYLHRRNFVVGDGKKTLALISQQVTIPLFLFSKVVYCNQDWSDEPCPDVVEKLDDIWVLLLWPIYVVGWGLVVGYVAATLSGTPNKKAAMAACAFGNSTGIPITLLTAVHSNFPSTTELGAVDPTLFLSVYLLLYPVLQWGVGGWLLAPEEEPESPLSPTSPLFEQNDTFRNVLNNDEMEHKYERTRRGLSETDASLYISEVDLVQLHLAAQESESFRRLSMVESTDSAEQRVVTEETSLVSKSDDNNITNQHHFHSLKETLNKIASRCLQPPVVGAIMGLVVAATPLRGILVDIKDRSSHAPLQWFFDALYAVGETAVPLNMMILGANLSVSFRAGFLEKNEYMTNKTMLAIVVGKMLVLPVIGVLSAIIFDKFIWDIPESINASFYLVAMIVFITPTANNVMVMVELSGSGAKEGIAQVIALQYAVAPLLLSITMTVVVGVASSWS